MSRFKIFMAFSVTVFLMLPDGKGRAGSEKRNWADISSSIRSASEMTGLATYPHVVSRIRGAPAPVGMPMYSFDEKILYEKMMEHRLKSIKTQIEELGARNSILSPEKQEMLKQHRTARQRLEDLRSANRQNWEHAQARMNSALSKLEKSLKDRGPIEQRQYPAEIFRMESPPDLPPGWIFAPRDVA